MTVHRFTVGETVLRTELRFPNLIWRRSYTVVACLSSADLQPVGALHSDDGDDRVASEHELIERFHDRAFRRLDGRSLEDCSGGDAHQKLVPWKHLPRAARHKNDQRQLLGDSYA
jgi:hypothetical protein